MTRDDPVSSPSIMRAKRDLSEGDLRALVSLLGDRDEKISTTCADRLIAEGSRAVPILEQTASNGSNPSRARAAALLKRIATTLADDRIAALADADVDLEEGAFLLARTEYPSLDVALYRARLDDLASALA